MGKETAWGREHRKGNIINRSTSLYVVSVCEALSLGRLQSLSSGRSFVKVMWDNDTIG